MTETTDNTRAPVHMFMAVTRTAELAQLSHDHILCFSDTDGDGQLRFAYYTRNERIARLAGVQTRGEGDGEDVRSSEIVMFNLLSGETEAVVPALFWGKVHVIAAAPEFDTPPGVGVKCGEAGRGNAIVDGGPCVYLPSGAAAKRLQPVHGVSHPHLFMVSDDSGAGRVVQVDDSGTDLDGNTVIGAAESPRPEPDEPDFVFEDGRLLLREDAAPVFAGLDALPKDAEPLPGTLSLAARHRVGRDGSRAVILA